MIDLFTFPKFAAQTDDSTPQEIRTLSSSSAGKCGIHSTSGAHNVGTCPNPAITPQVSSAHCNSLREKGQPPSKTEEVNAVERADVVLRHVVMCQPHIMSLCHILSTVSELHLQELLGQRRRRRPTVLHPERCECPAQIMRSEFHSA